jgi:ATP-binding cassette subfamily B (MDR/TAP) protein 6
VIVCFLILVGGRVINVFVPIYYKKIINALTPSQQSNTTSSLDLALGFTHPATGITFPLASILIYIFLRFLQVPTCT